jgi:uncharacterized membrane protein
MAPDHPAPYHERCSTPSQENRRNSTVTGVKTMRVTGIGHLLFALGLAGLGILSLFFGDFALNWQPVPAWVPARAVLACLSGALLLAGGLGLLVKRTASLASFTMAAFLLSWVLVLQLPRVASASGNEGMWLGLAESTFLMTGGWTLFASLANARARARLAFISSDRGTRIARILFGLACLQLGLSHFVYNDATAGMIPSWIPAHVGFAYLTGIGHIATGLAILCGVLPRLAATCEAAMITLFVILLHIPAAAAQPSSRLMWTMVFVATALAGAVWNIAASLRNKAWLWTRWSPQPISRAAQTTPG